MENETSSSSSPSSIAIPPPPPTTQDSTNDNNLLPIFSSMMPTSPPPPLPPPPPEEEEEDDDLQTSSSSSMVPTSPPPPLPPPPPPQENQDGTLPENTLDENVRYTTKVSSTTLNNSFTTTSSEEEEEKDDDSASDEETPTPPPTNWKDQFYTYTLPIPITEWGLQLMLQNKNNQCAIFRSYARCPDGSVGLLESRGLIRKVGDVIVGVEGKSVWDLSFKEVMGLISDKMKESEEECWGEGVCQERVVNISFMDGEEYWRRRNGVEEEREKGVRESMELNVAYEALESMRKANLEIEFGGMVDLKGCTKCLRLDLEERRREGCERRRRRGQRGRGGKKVKPCLVCGSPVCPKHCCKTFRKQNKIRICHECAPLFSHDFIVKCLDITISDGERRRNIDCMMDAYDRTRLLLKYSSQYIDEIADALQYNTKRNNGVTLGTCATSVASSVAGAVGIATIFTPLGPHLLIASLLFSGSATAVQSGSEAVNYFAEPNKLADKIIAIHAMMRSILSVTDVLRNALQREQVRVDPCLDEGTKEGEDEDGKKIVKDGSKAAAIAGGAAVVAVGRNSRLVTRASATVFRSARVALAAGGALTAASILLETNEMIRVTNKMRKGNPNKKADLIREIKKEVEDLPDTHLVAEEVEKYFDLMVAKPIATAALLEKKEEDVWVGENNTGKGNGGGDVMDQGDMLDAITCLEMQTAMTPTKVQQEGIESPVA